MPRERFDTVFGAEPESDVIPGVGARENDSAGQSAALEAQVREVFETLRLPVYQYLLSVFGDAAEAEDLTQDCFLQLYRVLLGGQQIGGVRFWIFRTAHNLAVNRRKHRQFVSSLQADTMEDVERLMADQGLNPEQVMLRRERFEVLHQGLKRLTLNERQCLYLRAEGFRYREIGEIMGVGVPTVGEYLRRSIRKLGAEGDE